MNSFAKRFFVVVLLLLLLAPYALSSAGDGDIPEMKPGSGSATASTLITVQDETLSAPGTVDLIISALSALSTILF